MIRFFPVALLALLSAGILTFCSPHPAHAQPIASYLETA